MSWKAFELVILLLLPLLLLSLLLLVLLLLLLLFITGIITIIVVIIIVVIISYYHYPDGQHTWQHCKRSSRRCDCPTRDSMLLPKPSAIPADTNKTSTAGLWR